MLLGFETNEIKKIWEKKSNLDQLRGNIDCAIVI